MIWSLALPEDAAFEEQLQRLFAPSTRLDPPPDLHPALLAAVEAERRMIRALAPGWHAWAALAVLAALAAGLGWWFVDGLLPLGELTPAVLGELARALGLDRVDFLLAPLREASIGGPSIARWLPWLAPGGLAMLAFPLLYFMLEKRNA